MTTPGHIAALHYLNANDVLSASSLLFRKKIDGHEEYNRMEADLELADGTKIWFNQGSDRSTVIEGSSIALTQGKASLTLTPEKLTVNTTEGARGDGGIQTNSHVVAGGNITAEGNVTAKCNLLADGDVFCERVSGDSADFGEDSDHPGMHLDKDSLTIGFKTESGWLSSVQGMKLTKNSLTFDGEDVRDISEYQVADGKMHEAKDLLEVTQQHCKKYPNQLFRVKDQGYARHLMMCLPTDGSKKEPPFRYWIVATGYFKWKQIANKMKPW